MIKYVNCLQKNIWRVENNLRTYVNQIMQKVYHFYIFCFILAVKGLDEVGEWVADSVDYVNKHGLKSKYLYYNYNMQLFWHPIWHPISNR